MLYNPKHEDRFDRLTQQLQRAPAVTANLLSNVIVEACMRLPAVNATRVDQLIEVGAWSDAALALIELELPAWKVRRLICEDGVWLCSLSRQPNMPIEFNDTADAYHEVLPLAILGAFVGSAPEGECDPRSFASAADPNDIRSYSLLRQLQLTSHRSGWHHHGQPPCDTQSLPRLPDLHSLWSAGTPGEIGWFGTGSTSAVDSSSIAPRRSGLPCLRTAISRKP